MNRRIIPSAINEDRDEFRHFERWFEVQLEDDDHYRHVKLAEEICDEAGKAELRDQLESWRIDRWNEEVDEALEEWQECHQYSEESRNMTKGNNRVS